MTLSGGFLVPVFDNCSRRVHEACASSRERRGVDGYAASECRGGRTRVSVRVIFSTWNCLALMVYSAAVRRRSLHDRDRSLGDGSAANRCTRRIERDHCLNKQASAFVRASCSVRMRNSTNSSSSVKMRTCVATSCTSIPNFSEASVCGYDRVYRLSGILPPRLRAGRFINLGSPRSSRRAARRGRSASPKWKRSIASTFTGRGYSRCDVPWRGRDRAATLVARCAAAQGTRYPTTARRAGRCKERVDRSVGVAAAAGLACAGHAC
jgi:hypothetical protein